MLISPLADGVLALMVGYLLGSIPFGLILTRAAGTQDLRSIGSGNIGATNVLRTGRKGLAAATLIGDALKGTAAVILAGYFGGPNAAMAAALGAFLGHLFPVWLKFRGGKGVATALGVLLGFSGVLAAITAGIWLAVAGITRYSSLAALVAAAAAPFITWWLLGNAETTSVVALICAVLIYRHKSNIRKLLAGSEGRIGGRKTQES